MKTMKTLLAAILALCLVASLTIPAMATAATTTATTAPAESTPATSAPAESTPAESTPAESTPAESTPVSEPTAGAAADEEVVEDEAPVEEVHTEDDGHDHDHTHEEEPVKEESAARKTIRIILTVLEVIASIALSVIVLMQSGKESGLSGAISGNSDSYMSKGGKGGLDKMLAKSTKWVALVWLVLTLVLSLI